MAKVRITNVVVLNNPSKFSEPFQFQITFECLDIEHGMCLLNTNYIHLFKEIN